MTVEHYTTPVVIEQQHLKKKDVNGIYLVEITISTTSLAY